MLVKLDSSSPNRGEHNKYLKPPPRPDMNAVGGLNFYPQKNPARLVNGVRGIPYNSLGSWDYFTLTYKGYGVDGSEIPNNHLG